MTRPRILLFGASGMLGSEVAMRHGHDTLLTIPARGSYDFTEPESVDRIIRSFHPEIVINCAAMTNVDACEEDQKRCFAVNCLAPRTIATTCEDLRVRFVHFSTDFAFDGKLPLPLRYHRTDPTTMATCAYGQSKLESEEEVQNECPSALVIRLSWLFGGKRPTFPDWIIKKAAEGPVPLPADRYGSPSYVPDIAQEVVKQALDTKFGLLHLTSSQDMTVSQMRYATECLRCADTLDSATLVESDQQKLVESGAWKARRPVNSGLVSDVKLRDWREALRHYLSLKMSLETV